MSFDVNVLSSKPVIKPAANMQNDGGAGNLGYMYQERKQKEEDNKNIFNDAGVDTFVFAKDNDVFEDVDVKFSLIEFFKELLNAVLKLLVGSSK